jgi:hypothetical protein
MGAPLGRIIVSQPLVSLLRPMSDVGDVRALPFMLCRLRKRVEIASWSQPLVSLIMRRFAAINLLVDSKKSLSLPMENLMIFEMMFSSSFDVW